jgi:large subunit ribosomal protein L10
MSKRIKDMLVSEIRTRVRGVRDILIVNSSRLDAVSDNRMRLALRKKDIRTLTVRNKLAKKALADEGMTGIDPYLQGPSTLIWGGEDIVALSKEIAKWAKDLKPLEIKGGISEGTPLSAAAVDQLSTSPGRLELIGQIVGLALSPGAQLAAAILGPGGKLAGQVKTLADKTEA